MAEIYLFDLCSERSDLNFSHMFFAAKFNPVKKNKVQKLAKFTCESFVDQKQSRNVHMFNLSNKAIEFVFGSKEMAGC